MWKTVIIDDDEQVIEGLKGIIPWERFNMTFVGEAYDGEEGIKLIQTNQPNIVVTDIYMPVLEGLAMVKTVRDDGFAGKVVILSGFDDFEYARQALRLRVDDYLSKPASKMTIFTVFEKIVNRLTAEAEEEIKSKQLEIRLNAVAPLLDRPFEITGESLPLYETLATAVRDNDWRKAQQAARAVVSYLHDAKELERPSLLHFHANSLQALIRDAVRNRTGQHVCANRVEVAPDQLLTIKDFEAWIESQVDQACIASISEGNARHRRAVQMTIDYVHAHYNEDLVLKDIAEEVGLSRKYLGIVFQKAVGESFKSYLTRVRMEKAKQLLLEGELYIYEIADQVGYSHVHYFTRQFKRFFHASPTEFINQKE
ncbi:helix-turn-helix domain-containing protein [Alkalihalobacillus clausii]|nr:helix-turn-helix domain-containing protein [Shouchella clausii]